MSYQSIFETDVNDLNGFRDVEWYQNAWHDFCVENNVLTREIYDSLSKEEQREISKGRPLTWGFYGGLWLVQNGKAREFQKAIRQQSYAQAREAAKQARKAAGWQDITDVDEKYRNPAGVSEADKTYLIDPNGKSKAANGQPYGEYAGPYDHIGDEGMFHGRFLL